MTQYERMVKGLLYDPADPEIMEEQSGYQEALWAFNQLKPAEMEKKQQYMREVFAECGENCYVELPLRANWGGHHLHLGSGIYANSNLTLVAAGNPCRVLRPVSERDRICFYKEEKIDWENLG